MKRGLLIGLLLLGVATLQAQYSIKLLIKNHETQEPLSQATAVIKTTIKSTVVADSFGIIRFTNLRQGNYTITISYIGFQSKDIQLQVPLSEDSLVTVLLEEAEEHDEESEVVVTSTRISRSIDDISTRTEVISGEELTEKGNMKPGDIRMLLNESTGIQTQQTSATSYNAGLRIQGLDGRYTQILRDGYPLYGGFAGSLSLLQIAPLDLKQVEVIKGSASTLYGGGAIAGLVNLISKTPTEKRELSFMTNATTAGGLDLSGFYSERYKKTGLTIFASHNSNAPFDPAGIGLTAIPKFNRYTINPRLFLYGNKTTADVGITFITESRTGGSMDFIKNGTPGFFENNVTDRIITQTGITHRLQENTTLQFKTSYNSFSRNINIPSYRFFARQQQSFSELTWNKKAVKTSWVIGTNFTTEDLREKNLIGQPKRDYNYYTAGVFVQQSLTLTDKFVLETGIRGDYIRDFGFELLPRFSAMITITDGLTTRFGGGFGYKAPSIFTEEAERRQFQQILPIQTNTVVNERSRGWNWDVNYRARIGSLGVNLNHLFFYTRLNRPLVLTSTSGGNYQFQNASGYIDTRGIETNLRLTYEDFKLFIGYTYTNANSYLTAKEWLPLTARHRLNNVLMYEVEGKWKIGLEAYYFSPQKLYDGTMGRAYWITGLMAEKIWEHISLFINFENFSDTRQTKFGPIYTGSINNPSFKDIYAPVDGFVVNGGIKMRW